MILQNIDSLYPDTFFRHQVAFMQAFEWIRHLHPEAPAGITPLGSAGMYGNVHGYTTRPEASCPWESHRATIDLQVCLQGTEVIQWSTLPLLGQSAAYDPYKDTENWVGASAAVASFRLLPKFCVLFMPNEPHRPMISNGAPSYVRKAVVKIPVSLLTSI